MNDFYEYSDYLKHYGILGMRWGIRRYQNSDGTLTSEGMRRYRKQHSREIMDDAKLLAQHHYNESVKKAKELKKSGKYDRSQYSEAKDKAKIEQKREIADAKRFLKNTADSKKIYKRFESLRKQTIKEIGEDKYRALVGSKIVNDIFTAGHAAQETYGLATGIATVAAMPGMPVYGILISGAVGAAGGAGVLALRRKIHDKIIDAIS